MTHRSLSALCVLGMLAAGGAARAQMDPMAAARQAASNQLGLLEYCQDQGFADADAVSAQRTALGSMPPAPAGAPSTDAMEALGRKGTLSVNGTETTLASLATTHNTTVGGMCAQMVSAAKQVAAARTQAGSLTAVPGMPAMPAMPAMPNGMPTMPGMPGMGAPSAAPR